LILNLLHHLSKTGMYISTSACTCGRRFLTSTFDFAFTCFTEVSAISATATPHFLKCATPNQQPCHLTITVATVISARAHLEMIAAIAIRSGAAHGLRDAMLTTTIGPPSPSLYAYRSTRENSTVDTWNATRICSPTTSIFKKDMISTT
jgi:hypothetical protein